MFTFAAITYNHESVIIEHMESIKKQILHFGKGMQIYLIVSDDASTDRTLWKVQKWVDAHPDLFTDVKILRSEKNQGITKNYTRAVQAVETDCFKILAGDDLYYKNNVFNVIGDCDLVFTPPIRFQQEIIPTINWNTIFLMEYCDFKSIKKILRYSNIIDAPSVFIKRTIAQDERLIRFVSKYKWLEDAAKWHYLFNEKENLRIAYEKSPKILYRVNGGISKDNSHGKHSSYLEERKKRDKEWGLKAYRYPKYINPYRYYMLLFGGKLRYWDAKKKLIVRERVEAYFKGIEDANGYLKEIRRRSAAFEKDLIGDDGPWKN